MTAKCCLLNPSASERLRAKEVGAGMRTGSRYVDGGGRMETMLRDYNCSSHFFVWLSTDGRDRPFDGGCSAVTAGSAIMELW